MNSMLLRQLMAHGFLYVTRHFNRCGYAVLESLIAAGLTPDAVIVRSGLDPWRMAGVGRALGVAYRAHCRYQRCRPLRVVRSEEVLARQNGILVLRVESINSESTMRKIESLGSRFVFLGGGWHEKLSPGVLDATPLGCINTHPSLLPEFRGTSITRWQCLHGVQESGVTIHRVTTQFDDGPILAQKSASVAGLTPQDMFARLSWIAAELAPGVVHALLKDANVESRAQDRVGPYFGRWTWQPEALRVDWHRRFEDIHRFVLANTQESYIYSGPSMSFRGVPLILRSTRLTTDATAGSIGDHPADLIVLRRRPTGTVVVLRQGEEHGLEILAVQRDGSLRGLRRALPPARLLGSRDEVLVHPEELSG